MTLPNLPGVSAETLAILKGLYFESTGNGDLNKAVTTATGLVGYPLEAPSKKLVPINTPLRNRFPRVGASKGGTATHWKQITSYNVNNRRASVSEGNRGATVDFQTADKLAAYKTISLGNSVTRQAVKAGLGFEDVEATTKIATMYALMIEEEKYDLGGNVTALATPAAPSLSTATTGGTIPAATQSVRVAALTLHGWFAGTASDGSAVGYSVASTNTTQVTSGAASTVTGSVTAVPGAVGYAWYIGAAGSEKFAGKSTSTSFTFTSIPGAGAAPPAVDTSADPNGYDGVIAQIAASGSGAYLKNVAAAFTLDDIDNALQGLWDNQQVQPTLIVMNSQENRRLGNIALGTGGTPVVRMNTTMDQTSGLIVGAHVSAYRSKVNGQEIPVIVHPWLPQGTILMISEMLPFPNNEITNVFEVELRDEYTVIDYAVTAPKKEFDVLVDGVLKVYFPAGCALLYNITPAS